VSHHYGRSGTCGPDIKNSPIEVYEVVVVVVVVVVAAVVVAVVVVVVPRTGVKRSGTVQMIVTLATITTATYCYQKSMSTTSRLSPSYFTTITTDYYYYCCCCCCYQSGLKAPKEFKLDSSLVMLDEIVQFYVDVREEHDRPGYRRSREDYESLYRRKENVVAGLIKNLMGQAIIFVQVGVGQSTVFR